MSGYDWEVIGAGNATCDHWVRSDTYKRNEIVSWMAGFATSEHLDLVSSNKNGYRLDLLSNQYLATEIEKVCSGVDSSNKSMFSILVGILKDFPKSK